MNYLLLGLCLVNTLLIIVIFYKQSRMNERILNSLKSREVEIEENSEENKKHIDDMLKMREMYESD